jgi:glycerophosphoryl diester phosphodiesterase
MTRRALVIAHRGYHRGVPENTIASFRAAIAIGADGIETDVRVARDGALVLYHDAEAPNGKAVAQMTRAELEQAAGYAVPTLEEALLSFQDVLWNIEVKVPADVGAVADAIAPHISRRLLMTSFDHDFVSALVRHVKVDCGLLFDQFPGNLTAYLRYRRESRLKAIVCDYRIVDESVLKAVRESGFTCFVYGAVTQREHERCASLELAGVITDYPDRMASAYPAT